MEATYKGTGIWTFLGKKISTGIDYANTPTLLVTHLVRAMTQMGKQGIVHPSYCCIAPQVPLPFEGQSQYAADFVAKQAEPLAAAAAPPLRQPLPFEGQSTYQQEFIAKRGECAELPQVTSARVALPFEGNSEYAREFSAGCGSQNRGRTGNVSVI